MTVESHLFVAVDDEGRPRRAFRTRQQAWDAVESDSYGDEDLVDVFPDVPVIAEPDNGE